MEDNQKPTEVKVRKPGSGRHPKNCQCGKHQPKSLNGAKETKFIAIRDGRTPEVLTKDEVLNSEGVTLFTEKSHTGKAKVVRWLELRAQNPNLKRKEIAELMGISDRTLEDILYRATKEGWLKFTSPLERLENEIMPKVLDNLSGFMDEKDRTATIETAKATIFKHYQEAKGIVDKPTTILALKVEIADPTQAKVINSSIVGVPRIIDTEVEEGA
jgi:hypothetical protein